MDPEDVNRLAMWGTIALLAVAGVVFAATWASGADGDPPRDSALAPADTAIPGSSSTAGAPAEPLELVEADDAVPATQPGSTVALGTPTVTTTTAPPGITTTSNPSPTDVATVTGTTLRPIQSTTTTVAETTTLPISTSTTRPTATTTTLSPPSTALPTTTSTTSPPTTSTSTTVPTTTTTSTTLSDRPALFVQRFDAYARGDDGDWQIALDVELGGTVGGSYRGQVEMAWSGAGSGSTTLITGGSGKVTATIGPFDGDTVTVAITGVDAASWVYDPRLNKATTSLTVRKPDG